jgi:hypothetical protein
MQADQVIGKYAVGGAVGASIYVEVSFTEDVDVFAALAATPDNLLIDLTSIYKYARAHAWEEAGPYIVIAGWKVQFLPPDGPLVEEAIEKAIEHDLDGMPMRVFTPEYLVAIALKVGRYKDKLRAQLFLETSKRPDAKFKLDDAVLSDILQRHGLLDAWAKFQKETMGR